MPVSYTHLFNDLSEEDKLQKSTLGYLIVTKEYTHLTSNAMKQFIIDNSSTYLLALILIALLSLFLAYILVKPIHRLETIAKHIARKEFDYPINVNRHDELGNLARSIDTCLLYTSYRNTSSYKYKNYLYKNK